MATTACQPIGTDIFNADNRTSCENYVSSIQRKLDKAVADKDKSKIRWYTHILSHKSRAVKILAVHRVTAQNQGKYTAGTDRVRMIRGREEKNKKLRLSLLNTIDIKKKPSPIKRVYIPKSNGKKRPLGIPTLADRIIQEILRTTLEPITEYHASNNSYGFRPKRSCHDAIGHLFVKLSRRWSKQWAEKKWESYEQVATYLLNQMVDKFGLKEFQGKQKIKETSGASWEIDAKGISEGGNIFLIVECRRYTTSRLEQEHIGALAYRIHDTGAAGGIIISPLGLQEGAKKIASYENIHEVTLTPNSTPAEYILKFLNETQVGFKDNIKLKDSMNAVLMRDGVEIDRRSN